MKKQSRSSLRRSTDSTRPSQPVSQHYSNVPPQGPYSHPYDWRYATQSPQQPYGPYHTMHQSDSAPTAPIPLVRKRSRTRVMVTGAAALAVVSGGVGAAVLVNQPGQAALN